MGGIIITPSTTSLQCPGTSITLTANAGLTSYLWSTGQTTSSITVSPTNCTTYSVTGTLDGCNITATYTPNILSTQITGPDLVCEGTLESLTYCPKNGEGTYPQAYVFTFAANTTTCSGSDCTPSYTWSTNLTGTGDPCNSYPQIYASGSSATVDIPYGDSYIMENGFTISVTTTCGGLSCSQSFVVNGCCGEPDPSNSIPVLNDPTLSSYGSNPSNLPPSFNTTSGYLVACVSSSCGSAPTWFFNNFVTGTSNSPLVINGTFIVDQPLDIENSEVYLGPNAKIQINPNGSLSLNNCYLHACDAMWNGIYVNTTSSSCGSIYINSSLIEDAIDAVVSNNNQDCPITIMGSALNKDYKGVDIENYSGTYPLTINTTTFACNTSTWTSWTWHLGSTSTTLDAFGPYANYESEIGVEVKNVNSITIGGTASVTDKNTFQNLYMGIYSGTSNTNIYNNTFNYINLCNTCSNPAILLPSGIFAVGDSSTTYTVNVGGSGTNEENNFNYSYVGVVGYDDLNNNILYNYFYKDYVGAYVLDNYHNHNYIDNNDMQRMNVGIIAENNLNSIRTEINSNNIQASAFGIFAWEFIPSIGTRYKIGNNFITGPTDGISAYNLEASTVSTNTVTVNYNSNAEGIYTAPAIGSNISYNTIGTSIAGTNGEGIRLDVGSRNTMVTCNIIDPIQNALSYWAPQTGESIDWNDMTNYSSNGLYLNSSGFIGIIGSTAHATNNSWNTDACSGAAFATISQLPGNKFYVNPAPCVAGDPTNNAGLNPVKFIQTTGEDCYDCADGYICGPPPPDAWAVGIETTNITTAHQIIHSDNSYPVFSSTSHWLEKYDLYAEVVANPSYFDTLSALDVTVQDFEDSVSATNMGYIYTLLNVLADTNGLSAVDVASANSLLSSISSPDTVENTYLRVYKVYTAMLAVGQNTPNTAQADTLGVIAPLCPEQYGPAVFTARALLYTIQDTILYFNSCEVMPEEMGVFHKPTKNSTQDSIPISAINVYPNPANTILNIEINLQQGQIVYFVMYNGIGEKMQDIELQGSLTGLPLNNLPSGIYYYRITDKNNHLLKADKQMIIH